MPPDPRQAIIPTSPCTYGVKPRHIQTSGIFRLPAELITKILDHFEDSHRKVLLGKSWVFPVAGTIFVERLTAIRRLTMTCWHLRNEFLPILWEYVEGCNLIPRHLSLCVFLQPNWGSLVTNGLYPQCSYLLLNPTICAYVQTISVDLCFEHSPEDLMRKFVDCLGQLHNLRTLEVFSTTQVEPITRELERGSSRFPSVRELVVCDSTAGFIRSCPNVETVTAPGRPYLENGATILGSCGKELKKLKRVVGVVWNCVWAVLGCPNLQEIGVKDTMDSAHLHLIVVDLRSMKHLAVVELDYETEIGSEDGVEREVRKDETKAYLKECMRRIIPILKASPTKERKFLRWKFFENHLYRDISQGIIDIVEYGELEVGPETALPV